MLRIFYQSIISRRRSRRAMHAAAVSRAMWTVEYVTRIRGDLKMRGNGAEFAGNEESWTSFKEWLIPCRPAGRHKLLPLALSTLTVICVCLLTVCMGENEGLKHSAIICTFLLDTKLSFYPAH